MPIRRQLAASERISQNYEEPKTHRDSRLAGLVVGCRAGGGGGRGHVDHFAGDHEQHLWQSGRYLAIAFTASNGTFSAAVAPSYWRPQIHEDRMNRRGYVTPAGFPQVDAATGAVANVNLLLPKASAMFYGRLLNNMGTPFAILRDASIRRSDGESWS